jgi:hypothetical protein
MANVYNVAIQRVGRVEPTGHVYGPHGTLVGMVAPDGQISIWTGQVVGVADSAGRCADATGQLVAMVQRGTSGVFDRSGHYQGYVAEEEVSLQLMAGAALLLLLGSGSQPSAG